METKQLQQTELIENYILNKLTEEQATEFEIAYLADQACIEQLEMTKKLHLGLKMVADDDPSKQVSKPAHWWQKAIPLWSAAALLVILVTPLKTFMAVDANQSNSLPYNQLNVISMPMAQMRGEQSSTTNTIIAINNSDKQLILAFYLDPDLLSTSVQSFRFQLKRQTNNQANSQSNTPQTIEMNDLVINSDDMIYVDLGKNSLTTGQYDFLLSSTHKSNSEENNKRGIDADKEKNIITVINQGQLAIIN